MPHDTRTALLDTAETAVRRCGFDAFSFADLASAVGIRKASIFYHFPSKHMLAAALLARYSDRLAGICARISEDEPTAARRLAALIAVYRDVMDDGQSLCLCVAFSTGPDSLPGKVVAGLRAFRDMIRDWLRETYDLALQDGTVIAVGHPAEEAAATLALLEGAQLAARSGQDPAAFDAAVSILSRRLSV